MSESENVVAAGRRLIELRSGNASEQEWTEASQRFATALRHSNDPAEIVALLDEDVEDDLPIAEKTLAFERVLELGLRTPRLLRSFAQHLWFHGPESDDRVASLRAEADALESR